MADTFQKHLQPGEEIHVQTARRILPRGWGADLTTVLAFCLGLIIVDEQYRVVVSSWSWASEFTTVLLLIGIFRAHEYVSDLRMRTAITDRRLLSIRQSLLPGLAGPTVTELMLSDISAIFVHPHQIVVETKGGQVTKLRVPTGAKALASRLAQSGQIDVNESTRLEAVARFLSVNLPIFIGSLAMPQVLIWMIAMIPNSDLVIGFIEFFDLKPGEFRRTVIALTFGIPIMILSALISILLASVSLFIVVLTFGAHIEFSRSTEVFTISPASQRRSKENFQSGWWHSIEDIVINTVYQRRQPG